MKIDMNKQRAIKLNSVLVKMNMAILMVPSEGIEPSRMISPAAFKAAAFADFAKTAGF